MRHQPPKYSICITNYNTINSIEEALQRIVRQTNEDFEIIVVDNYSTDGSLAVLAEYSGSEEIRLILKHTTRGAGRQASLEHAAGKYVIHMDLDDLWRPVLGRLLRYYHDNWEGKALFAPGLVIAPRQLLVSAGGWRDLQRCEDVDMMFRLERTEECVALPTNACVEREVKKWNWLLRLIDGYKDHRDKLRVGIDSFEAQEIRDVVARYGFRGSFVYVLAAITAKFSFRLWPLIRTHQGLSYRSLLRKIQLSEKELSRIETYLNTGDRVLSHTDKR